MHTSIPFVRNETMKHASSIGVIIPKKNPHTKSSTFLQHHRLRSSARLFNICRSLLKHTQAKHMFS